MSDSEVVLQGPGPYPMRGLQSASAEYFGGSVQLALYVIKGEDPSPQTVYAQMTSESARKLASHLAAAAAECDNYRRLSNIAHDDR